MQSEDDSLDISLAHAEIKYNLSDIEPILFDSINGALNRLEKNPVKVVSRVPNHPLMNHRTIGDENRSKIEDSKSERFQDHHVNMEVHVASKCLVHDDEGNLHLGTHWLQSSKKIRDLVTFAMGLIRESRPQYYDPYSIRTSRMVENSPKKSPIFEMCHPAIKYQCERFESDYFDTIGSRGLLYPSTDAAIKWCRDREYLMDRVDLTLDQYSDETDSFVTMDLFGLGMIKIRYLVPRAAYVIAGNQYVVDETGELQIYSSRLERVRDPELAEIYRKIKETKDQMKKLADRMKELEAERAKRLKLEN
jgi:hypothetical protein